MWHKADSLSLADNDPVTTWEDSSGLGRNYAQATASKKPLYLAAGGPNSQPCLSFDGDDFLALASNVAMPSTAMSYWIVFRRTMATGVANQAILAYSGVQNAYLQYNDSWYVSGNINGAPMTNDVWYIRSVVRTTTTTTWYSNAAQIGQLNPHDGLIISFRYLSTYNEVNSPLVGRVAEVIVYDSAVSDVNRAKLDTYLNNKYRIY